MTDGGLPLGHRYLLHEVIGSGAMGQVYRATTRDTGQTLAAKVLRSELASDEDVVARFVQERKILLRISSPNVVTVRDLVVEADTLAIVTDLVPGPNLRTYLEDRGSLAPAEATRMAAEVLRGLAAAHALGAVHRDVKPENVLVDLSGPEPVAKLSDFGVARMAHGSASGRMTALVGTVAYLAPELAEDSRATPAADVWSCGVMLYELLCGVTPFAAGNLLAMIRAAAQRDVAPIPGIPADLWSVIVSFLAKQPSRRPDAATGAAQLDALLPSLAGYPALPRLDAAPAGAPWSSPRTLPAAGAFPGAAVGALRGNLDVTATSPSSTGPLPAPAPLRPAPLRPAPSWFAAIARWGRRGFMVAGVAGTLVLVAAVLIAVAVVHRHPPSVSQRFPPVLLGGTVLTQRTWRLSGDRLTAVVNLRNVGSSPADITYAEVVPESVAHLAADLRRVAPSGYLVLKADPVLQWSFSQLPPSSVQTITYEVSAGGTGSPRVRLARLVADQEREEAIYDAQAHITLRVLHALEVVPATLTMTVGQSQAVTVTGTFDDGTPAPAGTIALQFATGNLAVAVVDTTGTVKAVAGGSTVVTVEAGSVSTGVTVTVVAPTPPATSHPRPTPATSPSGVPATPAPGPTTPTAPVPTTAAPPTSPGPPPVPHGPDDNGTGPSLVVFPTGNQAVFWRGTDGAFWGAAWDTHVWAGPVSAGMAPLGSEPTAGGDSALHYWVYWRGTDGHLAQAYYNGTKWLGPTSLPTFGILTSQPAATVAPNTHQWLFWKGSNGNLVSLHWTGAVWEGPVDTGLGVLNSHPTAILDANEHPYVYWKGVDSNLWEAFYDGSKWQGPTKVGMGPLSSAPAASNGAGGGGARAVFWRGPDNNLYAGVWSGSAWGGPVKVMNGPMASDPTVGIDNAGHAWVYWKGTDGKLWGGAYGNGAWTGPVSIPQGSNLG